MYVITDKRFFTSSVNCINWSVSLCRVESVLLPNKLVDQKKKILKTNMEHEDLIDRSSRFPKTTCTVTQWGKLFSFQPLNVKSLWHVWQYLIHSSINDIETQEACVEIQWCVVLFISSCEKMQVTNYTSHDFISETLYIVAYYKFYTFLFLEFLTIFFTQVCRMET